MTNAILLAGGSGTRCLPFSKIYSKQLLFLNGKAVIDYPIQTLVDLGVENITIILGSTFAGQVIDYCGNGHKYGVSLNYIYQDKPDGISSAANLCQKFVSKDENFYLILGDNYYEEPVACPTTPGAHIFLNTHPELKRFGVASIKNNKIIKIEEKPQLIDESYENYAITGLYKFDYKFFEYFARSQPSPRGEYEITDILKMYLEDGCLNYQTINTYWGDAGTIDNLNYLNYRLYNKSQHENTDPR